MAGLRHLQHIFILTWLGFGTSAARDETLPTYLTPCPQDLSPNEFNLCITNNVKAAFPHYIKGDVTKRVPSLDPLQVIRLDLEIRNPPLKITVLNGTMFGLKDLEILTSRTDLQQGNSEFDLKIPSLNLLGNYQANGAFLFMPVNSQGPINITIVDLDLMVKAQFSRRVMRDQVEHLRLKEVGVSVGAIGRGFYYLDNLLPGLLDQQLNDALNADWESVTREAMPSVSRAFSQLFKAVIGKILQPYPFNELFPKTRSLNN